MSDLVLTFDTEAIPLSLGEPLTAVEAKLSDLPSQTGPRDAELDRLYVELPAYGVSLLFKSDMLASVFLYIRPEPGGHRPFAGRVSLLPDTFFAAPTREAFIDALTGAGFAVWPKAYPNAVDLVGRDLRLRFEDGPNGAYVFIDDGARLRMNAN